MLDLHYPHTLQPRPQLKFFIAGHLADARDGWEISFFVDPNRRSVAEPAVSFSPIPPFVSPSYSRVFLGVRSDFTHFSEHRMVTLSVDEEKAAVTLQQLDACVEAVLVQ